MIETRDLLREAGRAGIALQPPAAQRLADFGALLLRWNRSFNLISHRDERRLLNRHLLDSLTALPWLKGHALADLGSGAGLPGIPLAIACPERNFVLIDRHEKRMRFVQQAVIEFIKAHMTN